DDDFASERLLAGSGGPRVGAGVGRQRVHIGAGCAKGVAVVTRVDDVCRTIAGGCTHAEQHTAIRRRRVAPGHVDQPVAEDTVVGPGPHWPAELPRPRPAPRAPRKASEPPSLQGLLVPPPIE